VKVRADGERSSLVGGVDRTVEALGGVWADWQ
jgi:hypothetical protein